MMNAVHLMGRITADPEVKRYNKDGRDTTVAKYTLAVERDYKTGNRTPVDYIACKAFGPNAVYAEEYFRKGDLVVVSGRIITEVYESRKRGGKQYVTLVQAEQSYFAKKCAGSPSGEELKTEMERPEDPFA